MNEVHRLPMRFYSVTNSLISKPVTAESALYCTVELNSSTAETGLNLTVCPE